MTENESKLLYAILDEFERKLSIGNMNFEKLIDELIAKVASIRRLDKEDIILQTKLLSIKSNTLFEIRNISVNYKSEDLEHKLDDNIDTQLKSILSNTIVETDKVREDYFLNEEKVIYIIPHSGSRPGCYPYQGKYYSMNNMEGTLKLNDGSRIHYSPISETTYGKPDGIFGINCRHTYIAINEESVKPDYEVPSKKDNDRIYKLEQKQTALERRIRNIKRQNAILKPRRGWRGDQALIKDVKASNISKLQDLLSQYREFVAVNHIKAREWRLGNFS